MALTFPNSPTSGQFYTAENGIEYRGHREDQYPPLEDFVDAYYWAQKGDNSLLDAYVSKVDAVKAKYPKPSN